MFNFDETNRKSKEAMDTMLKSYSDSAKGFQAIATEAVEYSKKSFEDAVKHFEALTGVRSLEAAFDLQSSYVISSYESLVAEASKISVSRSSCREPSSEAPSPAIVLSIKPSSLASALRQY